MENLAKAIFEHYEKYLGEMLGADSYPALSLQLMGYQDAVENCLTFATMGLSLHEQALGCCCEAVLAAEEDYDRCADLFVKVLSFLIAKKLPLGPGMAIGGIDVLAPEFYGQYHKSALYFTEPTLFTGAFRKIDDRCRIFMAFFISPEEEQWLKAHGTEAFEKLLEEKKADIISLTRESIC